MSNTALVTTDMYGDYFYQRALTSVPNLIRCLVGYYWGFTTTTLMFSEDMTFMTLSTRNTNSRPRIRVSHVASRSQKPNEQGSVVRVKCRIKIVLWDFPRASSPALSFSLLLNFRKAQKAMQKDRPSEPHITPSPQTRAGLGAEWPT